MGQLAIKPRFFEKTGVLASLIELLKKTIFNCLEADWTNVPERIELTSFISFCFSPFARDSAKGLKQRSCVKALAAACGKGFSARKCCFERGVWPHFLTPSQIGSGHPSSSGF
jgi:hypothetical protein